MKHFQYYPKIEYGNNLATNITVRAKIRDEIKKNVALFFKYVIRDDERPDIISDKYYGNSGYTWAIFYANDILNPLWEWPKFSLDFIKYLTDKYGSVESTTQTIHHYEYKNAYTGTTYIIDQNTYNQYLGQYEIDTQTFKNVRQVSVFDYESELNESKRNIFILDKSYVLQISNELANIFT